MAEQLSREQRDKLEAMIDGCDLSAVLEALSDICGEKAEHIRETWGDTVLAKQWDTACGAIGCLVATPAIQRVRP